MTYVWRRILHLSQRCHTLCHKAFDYAVEGAAFVMERIARLTLPFLARTQRTEVLNCLWNLVSIQAKLNSIRFGFPPDLDIQENLRGRTCVSSCPGL